MRRWIECLIFGVVIAGAWLACLWVAGASKGMGWGAYVALALAMVVSYGGLCEALARAGEAEQARHAARERRERE